MWGNVRKWSWKTRFCKGTWLVWACPKFMLATGAWFSKHTTGKLILITNRKAIVPYSARYFWEIWSCHIIFKVVTLIVGSKWEYHHRVTWNLGWCIAVFKSIYPQGNFQQVSQIVHYKVITSNEDLVQPWDFQVLWHVYANKHCNCA